MKLSRKLLFGASLAAMLAAAQPAEADPISGLIVSALSYAGVTTTVVAVNTFLVSTVISTALGYLSQTLNRSGSNFGIKTTLQFGGTVPRTFPIGMAMTPGSEAYPARTWGKFDGTPNAYFTRWIALSDLPTTLTGFICDDKVCTYGAGSPDPDLGYAIPEFRGGEGKDHLWVKFFDGTQTTADAWSVEKFGADPDYPYGDDQVGYGIAWARVTARIDKYFFSNIPNYKFVLGGVKLYDPTKDSTAGGSGSQRWDTPATWAVSDLAPVAKYNILRGISYNGQWLYGLQNTHVGCLPFDSWSAAINAAATPIEYKPGVSVAQFRCGGMVSTDTTPADLLTELNKCDNGRLTEAGGRFITRSGAIGAPVMSFTDADLLISEPKQFDQFSGQEETYNGVNATWPDPAQNWTMVDAAALLDSDLEASDGGTRRTLDIQYNFLPYGDQVQGMMKFARDEKRKFRKHTVIAPPRAVVLDPFDAIAWTSTENGYVDKIEEVIPTDQDNLDQGMFFTESDPADYDWDGETDYRTYTPVPIAGQDVPAQAIVAWDVDAVAIPGDDGKDRPGIKVFYSVTDIDDVDGILVEVRKASDASPVWSGESPHSVASFQLGEWILPTPFAPNTAYEVRGQYRPISARDVTWSAWLPVTTDDLRIGASGLYDEAISRAKLDAALRQFQDFVGAQASDLLARLRRLSQYQAEIAASTGLSVMELRRSVSSATGALRAEAEDNLLAATGPTSALALAQTALEADLDALSGVVDTKASTSALNTQIARIDANEGDITAQAGDISDLQSALTGYTGVNAVATAFNATNTNVSANADAIVANSDNILSLTSSVGQVSASGLFRVSTEATPSGYDSRIGLTADGSAGADDSSASIFIDAKSGSPSRVMLVGDQISILDNSANVLALFTDGGAYLNTVIIKDASIGTLHLENGAVSDPQTPVSVNGDTGSVTGGNHDISTAVTASHTYDNTGFVEIGYTGACGFSGTYTGWRGTVVCIRVDGATLTTLPGSIFLASENYSGAGGFGGGISGKWFDTSPVNSAGVTYKLQFQTTPGRNPAGTAMLTLTGALMSVQFRK